MKIGEEVNIRRVLWQFALIQTKKYLNEITKSIQSVQNM